MPNRYENTYPINVRVPRRSTHESICEDALLLLRNLTKKTLELYPSHPILTYLAQVDNADNRSKLVFEQLYEDMLLIEGPHEVPTSITSHIHRLIEKALN